MRGTRALAAGVVVAVTAGSAVPAWSQAYPSRPIQIIVAYAAGGTGDIVARSISDKLGIALGQSVVVENRAGASGAIGAHSVTTAAPDGYTLLVGQTGEIAVNQHWLKGLNYDPDKDLMPIALAAVVPLALVVPSKAPYSTLPEFLAALKTKPKMTFASAGIGTPGHFAGELLKLQFDENLTHVPYKGAGPALNDLIGNHVDFYFPGFPAAAPHVKGGNLKILAISAGKRSPAAPDVPTVAEVTGNKDYDFTLWAGFFAPRGTPQTVIDRLNKEINKVVEDPDVKARLEAAGAVVSPMTVAQFRDFVQNESAKYLRVIKQTGVTSQ
ncbi:MAG TPA: tripartite tricarboxylate transporter substrate binding protein [Pseudolabrys sp.]|jgi:tripartite-type tricarboxylate transporter receptor subunit TctC|nr:tripartite tricarboxylate transporter substrate binding protein [Pseudolabrys sp.]